MEITIVTFEHILFDLLLGLRKCVRIQFSDRLQIDRFLTIVNTKEEYSKIMSFVDNNGLCLNTLGRFYMQTSNDYLYVKDNEFLRIELI